MVAVSGGQDSTCLLHSLHRLRRLLKLELVCFHFDHRLRPGSGSDADYVRAQARRLRIPFVSRAAGSSPARGESVEAWARIVRYEALREVVEERGAAAAVVGHTADDQAETVLLALLRGGGLEAVSGMRPVSRPLVRPLLNTTRDDTGAFCRALGLRPRRDPMNEDLSFMRVAIRNKVIPALEEVLGRGVRATLARTAALLQEDADLLQGMADEAEAGLVRAGSNEARLKAAALLSLPGPLAGRILRRAILALGVLPESGHVTAVMDLAGGRPGRRLALPAGLEAIRDREYVRLSRPSPEATPGDGRPPRGAPAPRS